MNARLQEIKEELEEMNEREYKNLWKLARKAEKHGCSKELVNSIREEGWWLYNNSAYPERVLEFSFEYKFKYAYKF